MATRGDSFRKAVGSSSANEWVMHWFKLGPEWIIGVGSLSLESWVAHQAIRQMLGNYDSLRWSFSSLFGDPLVTWRVSMSFIVGCFRTRRVKVVELLLRLPPQSRVRPSDVTIL